MASGQEMMMNTVLKMLGFDSADAKRDIGEAVATVLRCGEQLNRMERNQIAIMQALKIGEFSDGQSKSIGRHHDDAAVKQSDDGGPRLITAGGTQ